MAMVDLVRPTCCLQADLRLKSVGLVQRSVAVWRCSAFIAWNGWTRAMTVTESWWQHRKHYPGIIIIIIIIIVIIVTVVCSCCDGCGWSAADGCTNSWLAGRSLFSLWQRQATTTSWRPCGDSPRQESVQCSHTPRQNFTATLAHS